MTHGLAARSRTPARRQVTEEVVEYAVVEGGDRASRADKPSIEVRDALNVLTNRYDGMTT
jgi:hypothetical protein